MSRIIVCLLSIGLLLTARAASAQGSACVSEVYPSSLGFTASGAYDSSVSSSALIHVTAPPGCSWSLRTTVPWVAFPADGRYVSRVSGTGSAQVGVFVGPYTAETDAFGRRATINLIPGTGAAVVEILQNSARGRVDYPFPIPRVPGWQLDSDRRDDVAVWRPGSGTWYTRRSQGGLDVRTWGLGALNDVPVAGDYDGDGKSDHAVWRPSNGTWYVLKSSSGYTQSLAIQWGAAGDVPLPADYDGDGVTDLGIWRPATGTWYLKYAWLGFVVTQTVQWGAPGDRPVPADYDGDGRADVAVWRPADGVWYMLPSWRGWFSNNSPFIVQWGSGLFQDQPVAADYTGDGLADPAVWRPGIGTWYILDSSDELRIPFYRVVQWGAGVLADQPVVADYDGDKVADIAVWRPSDGVWYVKTSSSLFRDWFAVQWGSGALQDVPVPK